MLECGCLASRNPPLPLCRAVEDCRLLSSSAPPSVSGATSSDGDDHRGGGGINHYNDFSSLSLSLSLSLRLLLLRILVIWRRKRNKFEATPEASAFASSIQSNGALPVSERGQWGSREIYSAPLLIGIRLRPDHPRVCLGASRRFIFNGNVESPIRDPVSHPR